MAPANSSRASPTGAFQSASSSAADLSPAGSTTLPRGERVIGSVETGVDYTGTRRPALAASLSGAVVLASRSEVRRGESDRYADHPFTVVPMGSVAYKCALVAAGRADTTWTLTSKHEWDVAAGAALVTAAAGGTALPDGSRPSWNNPNPLMEGFVATSASTADDTARLLGIHTQA